MNLWARRIWILAAVSVFGCRGGAETPVEVVEEFRRDGKIVLGSPSLTAGIPGEGPLKVDEVKAWLDDPKNHEPLDFVLPAGLHDAEPLIVLPDDEPFTRASIELGRQLFFDVRLAEDEAFSCANCHIPEQSFSAYLIMPEIGRNASVSFNRLFSREQFWDGRAKSLSTQPESPLLNKFEMNTTIEACLQRLNNIEGYRLQFKRVYGELSMKSLGSALAAFQRALVTGPAPWDAKRHLAEFAERDESSLTQQERQIRDELRRVLADRPMSESARRGEAIFFSERARCGDCHSGPNLTDEQYHNLGVGMEEKEDPDLGRYHVTLKPGDLGAFKTPTLRNVAESEPYMHNGELTSLEAVIDYFVAGGHPNENLDSLLRPVDLGRDEREDLVAFLESLSGPLPVVQTGRLPQ